MGSCLVLTLCGRSLTIFIRLYLLMRILEFYSYAFPFLYNSFYLLFTNAPLNALPINAGGLNLNSKKMNSSPNGNNNLFLTSNNNYFNLYWWTQCPLCLLCSNLSK